MSDSTIDGHPMLFSEGPDGTHAGHRVQNHSDTVAYFANGRIVSQDTYMNSFDTSHPDYSHRRFIVLTTPPMEVQGYYFCAYHTAMGAGLTVEEPAVSYTRNFDITVAEGVYFVDGSRTPDLSVLTGEQVLLNMSDSTVDGHPMLLSDGPDGTHAGHRVVNGSDNIIYFVDNAPVAQDTYMNSFDSSHADFSRNRFIVLTAPPTAVQGYYFCAYHTAMGAGLTVVEPADPYGQVFDITAAEGVYFIDGTRTPDLYLPVGQQVLLNMSDSTVDGHPMLLSNGPDGTHASHRVLNHSDTIIYLVDGLVASQDTYMNSFDSSHADYSHRCGNGWSRVRVNGGS